MLATEIAQSSPSKTEPLSKNNKSKLSKIQIPDERPGEIKPQKESSSVGFPAYYDNLFPKDERIRAEITNQLHRMRKNVKSLKERMPISELRNLQSIDSKNGQFMKGKDPIKHYNLFNDLNYGDFLIVFHNPFYEFMFQEVEENLKKIRIIEKQQKLKRRSGGSLSKSQVDALRDEDERFQEQSEKR